MGHQFHTGGRDLPADYKVPADAAEPVPRVSGQGGSAVASYRRHGELSLKTAQYHFVMSITIASIKIGSLSTSPYSGMYND